MKWTGMTWIAGSLIGVAAMVLVTASASAETNLSIGMDYWYTDWEISGSYDVEADGAGMYGPTIQVSVERFIFGGYYLQGDFDATYEISTVKYDAERTDMSGFIGFRFSDHFSARVFYERLTYEQDFSAGLGLEETQTGIGLGLSAHSLLGESGFFVFGAASYSPWGQIESKLVIAGSEGEAEDWDATKYNLQGGLGYAFDCGLSMSASYRYNVTQVDNEDENELTFAGPMASVYFTF